MISLHHATDSMEEPLTDAKEIYRLNCWLLGRETGEPPLRLLGLGVSGWWKPSFSNSAFPFGR